MKFVSIRNEQGENPPVGMVLADGSILDLQRAAKEANADFVVASPLHAALDRQKVAAFVATLGSEAAKYTLPAETSLGACVPNPTRIFAIGRNYAEHAKEQGHTVGEEPIVFLKASTCVIGQNTPIEIPDWVGRVDYEGELLVVLGQGGKNIGEAEAMDLVAGYTLFNDITARDIQRADQKKGHPWFRSKSMDTFGPMGAVLVTPDEVPNPHALHLRTMVNGVIRQDDTTAAMVFQIPTLIAYLSRYFALRAGDVIATGTPSGIGPIVPGDTVTISIEGLGTLTNPVTMG